MQRASDEDGGGGSAAASAELPEQEREIAAFYDERTRRILAKYGPGPRVHYHTGMSSGAVDPRWSLDDLRARMVESQEALLDEMALGITPREGGLELLDVGCGLGGGALYWAASLGADVTAITIVPSHVTVVRDFARAAGLAGHVRALLCDAHTLRGADRFDVVVAIESSGYLDRRRWFQRVASLLRPGGTAHVADWMVGRPEAARPVDAYYRTRLGSPEEYQDTARAAGLRVVRLETWSERVAGFWTLSRAWSAMAMAALPADAPERARLERSRSEHEWLGASFLDGGLHYGHLIVQRG